MKPALLLIQCVAVALVCGCGRGTSAPARKDYPAVIESRPGPRAEETYSGHQTGVTQTGATQKARATQTRPEVSFDTQRDKRFAEFVAKSAGDMVHKVAVGIERRGVVRVELGKNTDPEDTLPLTKSLMAGARKDFPGQAITLSIFDPEGQAILKAHYHPDHGVRYEVAHARPSDSQTTSTHAPASEDRAPEAAHWESAKAWSGATDSDRRFAEWAFGKGHKYLRYVQADLERNGRLWFGVTSDVQPQDVAALTKSILQGARTEFPGRAVTAKVFDPHGETIGNASLGSDGQIHWAHVAPSK